MDGDLEVNLFEGAFLDSSAGENVDRDDLNAASGDDMHDLRT